MRLFYVNNGCAEKIEAAGRMRLAKAGRQGGVVLPGPQDRLPRRLLDDDEQAAVWWLGAHGGAGESTLEELFSGSRAADHSWPLNGANGRRRGWCWLRVLTRTGSRPRRARSGSGRPGTRRCCCSGLVLIADAPARLPHGLRQLAELIAGGVPAVWSLPWIEAWRVGEPPAPHNAPKVVRQLLEDLRGHDRGGRSATSTERI